MNHGQVLVWDLPVRLFHWLLALSFAGAYLTGDSARLRDVHVMLGYTMAGLVAFRLRVVPHDGGTGRFPRAQPEDPALRWRRP